MSDPANFREFLDRLNWPFPTWEQLKPVRDLITENWTNVAVAVVMALAAAYQAWNKYSKNKAARVAQASLPAPGFPTIESLENFDWKTTEPIKLRPFKPRYHLTMDSLSDDSALETLSPSELVPIDSTYQTRLQYRCAVVTDKKKRPEIINIDPKSNSLVYPAIAELYTWLFSHYLPIRYPTMFKLYHTMFEYGREVMLQNLVTGQLIPARSKGGDGRDLTAERMLETMATMLDEDFLFLLPEDVISGKKQPPSTADSKNETAPSPSSSATAAAAAPNDEKEGLRNRKPAANQTNTAMSSLASKATTIASDPAVIDQSPVPYVLCAYATCMPNGFRPSEKLGRPLRTIHVPVPNYDPVIAGSMDRFFSKIEVGRYVKRANWSMALSENGLEPELFAAPMGEQGKGKMHGYEGDVEEEIKGDIDGESTFIRCERQTLHRLPKSQALVFAFHTYLYPLSEIKAEPESRDALIEAIDGVKAGNSPGMHFYKRVAVWGESVKRYLRS